MKNIIVRLLGLCFLLASWQTYAYDTLKISVKQADSIFFRTNYQLLASAMNIDIQKAQIIQAKLYPNPIFTADFNAYDPQNKIPFHVDNTGQKAFQLEQLILLGGKRRSQIELAKNNSIIAELEFQEIVRKLKFQLHAGIYALNQQRSLINKYNNQLSLLDTILTVYEVQAAKGNIPLKDVVRLKGVYLNLNNEKAALLSLYFEELRNVQTILQTSSVVIPVVSESEVSSVIKQNTFDNLIDSAFANRPDYLIAIQNKVGAEQYYTYQKKMAIPDINLTTAYDQRGGAFQNQFNVGFAIPLPLWNRNRGNIKSAKYAIKQFEYSEQGLKNEISIDLENNLAVYNQAILEYNKAVKLYNTDFEITLKGMTDNFQKRNVNLIEFVDFFEAYNNTLAEVSRVKIQLMVSAEQLNLTIGKELY